MSTALATLTTTLAGRLGFGDNADSTELIQTLKATAFKGDVTDAQLAALLVVANQYGLNPWTKEIYAFPDKKNGIVPVVGVDGWARIINENPALDGLEFKQSSEMVTPFDCRVAAPEWMECLIYRKDRNRPIIIREYLDEVYRPPFEGTGQRGPYKVDGPWQSHPKRFLRHKTMIQCARIAFGFAGIYDDDEAKRIVEAEGERAKYMGVAERVDTPASPATKPALPGQSDDEFAKNMVVWTKVIKAGKKDVDGVLATVATISTLTDAQVQAIKNIPVELAKATTAGPTFAQVADALINAKDEDALNVAADLINSIPDEQQRTELNAKFDARRAELNA